MYVYVLVSSLCNKIVIDVVQCLSPGEQVPILFSSGNQTTVEGENITFNCTFKGNYSESNYDIVYWKAILQNGSTITIQDNSNFVDHHIETKQSCPPTKHPCCCFTTKLRIHASLPLNNAVIICTAQLYSDAKNSSISNLSKLQIIHKLLKWMHDTITVIKRNGRRVMYC